MAFIYNMTDTWNSGATVFTAIKMNVTDTASDSGSFLMQLQVGGVSQFIVAKNGNTVVNRLDGSLVVAADAAIQSSSFKAPAAGFIGFTSNQWFLDLDTYLSRDAAGILAQRNSTNAQTFRVYGTFTDASNYERGAINTGADYVELAAETAGTGDDNLDVRITPAGTGQLRYSQAATANTSVSTLITSGADSSTNLGHRFSISLNGTTYWVPCSSVAF